MAISDDRRDISENAALRESKSASRLSALDFIWSEISVTLDFLRKGIIPLQWYRWQQ